jgi:hypothetical protein
MLALKNSKKYEYDFITIESDVIEEVEKSITKSEDVKNSHSTNTNSFIFPTLDSYCDVLFVAKNNVYYDDFGADTYVSTTKTISFSNRYSDLWDTEYLKSNLFKTGDTIKINRIYNNKIDFTIVGTNKINYVFDGFDKLVITNFGKEIDILDFIKDNCSIVINDKCPEYIINYAKILKTIDNFKRNISRIDKVQRSIENFVINNMDVGSTQSTNTYRSIKYVGKICLKSARLYSSLELKLV